MINVKKLRDCTISEMLMAWNDGFEGYASSVSMSETQFLERMIKEDFSVDLSIVAFDKEKPIGIVMHGVRDINGKKVAWNGGTGVAKNYRGRGIGKHIMGEGLTLLKEAGVEIATLEVLCENENAFSLYKKLGYSMLDTVKFLKGDCTFNPDLFPNEHQEYHVERVVPQKIRSIPFYKAMNPWQTQIDSAKNAKGIVVRDQSSKEVGYAYYQLGVNKEGKVSNILLYQCEPHPEYKHPEEVIYFMLSEIFSGLEGNIPCVVPNLPVHQSEKTYKALEQLCFKSIADQYYMMKEL